MASELPLKEKEELVSQAMDFKIDDVSDLSDHRKNDVLNCPNDGNAGALYRSLGQSENLKKWVGRLDML
jgi:hypothetical protein